MIETLAVSADLDRAVLTSGWAYRRQPHGGQQWSAPRDSLPDGLGSVLLSLGPDGTHRARIEGNLTTLLHGKYLKYGSLYADEIEVGAQALIDVAANVAPGLPRSPARWWVRRYDPSATFRVGDQSLHVLDGAALSFRRQAAGLSRQTVTTIHPGTVTWRLSKHRSVTVYDKTRESISRLIPCPRGLVRVEVRRIIEGNRLPLTILEGRVMDEAEVDSHVDQMMEATGATVMSLVDHLRAGGADAGEALRLASTAMLLASHGDDVLEHLGIPYRTAHRQKVRIRQLLARAGELRPPESTASLLRDAERVMARDEEPVA